MLSNKLVVALFVGAVSSNQFPSLKKNLMNNLAVQVSPDNQKVLEDQGKVNEDAFHAATSNNQFVHGVAPAYEEWAATQQTQ